MDSTISSYPGRMSVRRCLRSYFTGWMDYLGRSPLNPTAARAFASKPSPPCGSEACLMKQAHEIFYSCDVLDRVR
jgi:hypothetical protein